MQGKHNFIFSLDGEQKSFLLQKQDVSTLCRVIRAAYDTDVTISALMDAQGNICDLNYFCQNLNSIKDKFYVILSEKKQKRSKSRQSRQSRQSKQSRQSQKNNGSQVEEPQYYIGDFQHFISEMQSIKFSRHHPVVTIVLIFDNENQAKVYGQQIIEQIYERFAFLQAYYTVVQEEESLSVLVAIFENQHLKDEVEIQFSQYVAFDVCDSIDSCLQQQEQSEFIQPFQTQQPNQQQSLQQYQEQQQYQQQQYYEQPESNNIPLIVTRGDQRQVLQVEANDNFHSAQGKRTHGVMRVKKALEKVKDRMETSEYEYLLGLIIAQDQTIFAAYQLYQRTQDDAHFIQGLRGLIPQDHNLSFNHNTKIIVHSPGRNDLVQDTPTPMMRSPESIIGNLVQSGLLDTIELGMLRVSCTTEEFIDLIKSLFDQNQDIMIQLVKCYLKEQFYKRLRDQFNAEQICYIQQEQVNKLSPIYSSILHFSNNGQINELFDIFKENVEHSLKKSTHNKEYSYYLLHQRQTNETFHFQINGMNRQDSELEVKDTIDANQLQHEKELNIIDKYHHKVLQKYTNTEYEKLFVSIYDQCTFFDEVEKAKLVNFYNEENQRLLEILDKYGKQYNINAIKQDLNDLVTLQNKRYEDISSPTNSAIIEPKMQKLKNFKFLVNYLYEIDKEFTLRQIKTFYYLYATEDMSIMSAYEVYCETKDQEEFIETLQLIYKISSLSNQLDLNEIETFDQLIEQQLNILFAYRRFFNLEQRSALEKNLRAGDNTLLKQFRDFLRNKDQKVFIQQVSVFADKKIDELRNIEKELQDNKVRKDEMKSCYKDMIQQLYSQFFKAKIKYLDILLDAVDRDNIMVKSSFEVYEQTLDKQDLVENLALSYNHIYKNNVRSILKAVIIQLQGNKTDLTYLLKKIDYDEPILKGAFELYFQTRDEGELKDTIHRILKFSSV